MPVEPSGGLPQPQVGLLSDVLGKCSVGHHPQGKTVGGGGCGVVELSERLRVTLAVRSSSAARSSSEGA